MFTGAGDRVVTRQNARLELPGATRMWSQETLAKSTFEQRAYLGVYFEKHDASNQDRLTSIENDEVRNLASHPGKVRKMQQWSEGAKYTTSTGSFVVVEEFKSRGFDERPVRCPGHPWIFFALGFAVHHQGHGRVPGCPRAALVEQ